ncbi:MAG: hypothetical protein WC322_00250 [Candidatus Paceibacterota bacterium]|jgi:hypothetical protein
MKPLQNWRQVLKQAWSVRLIALTVLLLVLDLGAIVLEVVGMLADRPGWSIALRSLAALCGVAAFVARFIAQKGLSLKE